jgi:uncharacterized delta-60 repeat protein
VAGYIRNEVAVACYQPDGQLDETFGTDGVVSGVVTGLANDVTIQPDGRIVIAGRTPPNPPRGDDFDDLYVARLLADGQLDGSFGRDGLVVTDVGGLSNEAQNVVVQPADEMIVLSGSSRNPGSSGVGIDHHTDLARYDPDGQPDPTFGNGGTLTLDAFVGAAIALQPDGRIVVAGATGGPNSNFAVARLLPDGTLDPDFTDTGVMTIDFFGFTDLAESVAVTDDGSILVSGLARDNVDGYGVARLSPSE